MKPLSIITILPLFITTFSFSQNKISNPFESIGKESKTLTLTKGKYQEDFINDTLQRIGNVVYNTINRRIEFVIEDSVVMSEDGMDMHIVSRWLGRDPKAMKYPNMTPYNFVGNNPIWAIDPDGQDSLIVHRSKGIEKNGVLHFVITFSVIQKGVEKVLPYEYHQATNADYVQAPKNSDVPLSFQQMASHPEEEYKNTIRMWIKKPNGGGYYATFMHPTAYPATALLGCASTYCDLKDDGEPNVDTPPGENEYLWEEKETSEVLNFMFQLYSHDYKIGDRSGNYEGNDFFMRTDSYATAKAPIIQAKTLDTKVDASLAMPSLPSGSEAGTEGQ